jgi:hypothetical protein
MDMVWSVRHMEVVDSVDTLSKVVDLVRWTLTATEGTQSSSIYGFEKIPLASGNFVPFEQLTEAGVIDWCHKSMGNLQRTEFEKRVTEVVSGNLNPAPSVPKVDLPLPWVLPPTPEEP